MEFLAFIVVAWCIHRLFSRLELRRERLQPMLLLFASLFCLWCIGAGLVEYFT